MIADAGNAHPFWCTHIKHRGKTGNVPDRGNGNETTYELDFRH